MLETDDSRLKYIFEQTTTKCKNNFLSLDTFLVLNLRGSRYFGEDEGDGWYFFRMFFFFVLLLLLLLDLNAVMHFMFNLRAR